MAATTTQPTTSSRTTEKTCSLPTNKEQLSATSECSGETACEALCQQAVQERAYYLWEKAGYPSGDGQNFWFEAEEQLRAEAEAE